MRRFLCFKRINRAFRFDGFLWNLAKMFPGYQCAKVFEAFLIFQIVLLLRALLWRRSANIQFVNFKIDFLGNQSEYRKSLTRFCSLSPTDWHCAVCLVLRASIDCKTVVFGGKRRKRDPRMWSARASHARMWAFSLAVFHSLQTFRSNMVRRSRSQKIRLFCSLVPAGRQVIQFSK